MSYAMIPDDSINYEEGAILCDFDDIIILVPDHYGQYMLQELVSRYTIKGVEEEALSIAADGPDNPQSFVTEPEGYKMILNVAEAIRDSAESKD